MRNPIRELDALKHVEKKDGAIAAAFVLLYATLMPWTFCLMSKADTYIYEQLIAQSGWILLILLMLRLRKQRLHTIGFSRSRTPYVAFAAFTIAAAVDAFRQANLTLLGRWFFYAVAVGGMEEILFRGYLHPRLTKLLNSSTRSILLAGMLFGAMHHIVPMVWHQTPWQGVFNELGRGVIGHWLFLLVYACTGNIADAILLHAVLDYSKYTRWMLVPCILYIAARIVISHLRGNQSTKLDRAPAS